MYTFCTVKFIDDNFEFDTIIKSNNIIDENDDKIFYYGLSREDIVNAYKSKKPIDNEWVVVEVGGTVDLL